MKPLLAALLLLAAVPASAYADAIIVMIAATPTGDGVLTVPVGGDAAFAVAVVNVGSRATLSGITLTPLNFTGLPLPLVFTRCETDPGTGQCLAQPHVTEIGPGEIRTYSVFVHASGPIEFNPARTRLLLEYETQESHFPVGFRVGTYASTSVAVRTAP